MNPYFLTEQSVISFSGGRSSAYMLFQIIQSHGGTLPDHVKVVFANTGKETEETLVFVRDVEKHFGSKIHWVEYTGKNDEGTKTQKQVTFETASRNGEPFELIIRERGMLPNPRARFCTVELKLRAMDRFIKSEFGFDEYVAVVGIRADEPHRVARLANNKEGGEIDVIAPMANAGVTAGMVGEFWRNQSFDLGHPNNGGITPHGNCDLCFLKAGNKIQSLIRENPSRAMWWAKQEEYAKTVAEKNGQVFRIDRPSYQKMIDSALNQNEMFDFIDDSILCVGCTE